MKQIIDGRRYNTEAATLVAEDSRGYGGDFPAFSEALYVTKAGRWFLAGQGGPMTRYAEAYHDGSRSGGTRIIPMDPSDALLWLEHNGMCDAIELYFHDVIEDA